MPTSQDAETTISPQAKRLKYPSVWLDMLPLDICIRIVSFLPRDPLNHERNVQYLSDALSLAAVSSFQQLATSSAQSHSLSIEKSNNITHSTILIRYWRRILDEIREVHLPIDIPDSEDVRNLLSLPTIKKAAVPNYPCVLRALQTGRAVRQLELRLTMYCPQDGHTGLATGISRLLLDCPIEELRLICLGCNSCPGNSCFAALLLRPAMRERKCDNLRSLHMKCSSVAMGPLMKIPSCFPNLEDFRVEHWLSVDHVFLQKPVKLEMSDEMYQSLRKVKRLEIIHCGSIDTFVPRLGSNLLSLGSVIAVSSREVMALEACSNLRSLDIVLKEGAEVCFPLNLCNLHEISLTWNPDHSPSLSEEYYTPDGDILSGLIRRNKQVQVVKLQNARVTSFTLKEVLSNMGDRLQVLYSPIFHQGESPARRLSKLATFLARYNNNLSELEVCPPSFLRVAKKFPVLWRHEHGTCNPNACAFCELLRWTDLVLRVLKRRNLRFRDDGLRRLQFNLQPWC